MLTFSTRTPSARGNSLARSIPRRGKPLRKSAEAGSLPEALIDPGVVLKVLECSGDWCRLEVKGYKGWMMKTEFWGVYPAETLTD